MLIKSFSWIAFVLLPVQVFAGNINCETSDWLNDPKVLLEIKPIGNEYSVDLRMPEQVGFLVFAAGTLTSTDLLLTFEGNRGSLEGSGSNNSYEVRLDVPELRLAQVKLHCVKSLQ